MKDDIKFYGKVAIIFAAMATIATLTVLLTAFVFYKITIT